MPSSIGPNTYSPGQCLPFTPDGRICDHGECDNNATICIVGETDSFGSELLFYCNEHYLQAKTEAQEAKKALQFCEIHKGLSEGCVQARDPEEGMAGRVYTMCPDCHEVLYGADPDSVLSPDELDQYDTPFEDLDFDPELSDSHTHNDDH